MNTITLEGNLVAPIEVKQSGNGNPYAFFTLAVNEQRATNSKDAQGRTIYEEIGTVYHNCVVFGYLAKSMGESNIPKGATIIVSGTLHNTKRPAYVTKDGREVPERIETQITVNRAGLAFRPNTVVTRTRTNEQNAQQPSVAQATPTQTPTQPSFTPEPTAFSGVEGMEAFDITDDDLPF